MGRNNETRESLSSLYTFMQTYTNILIVNLPRRYDFKTMSCVNQEVNTFNRKLGIVVKIFDHVYQFHVVYDGDLHTRHGLHVNKKGKESVAKQLASVIKDTFENTKKALAPVPMQWIVHEKVTKHKETESSKEKEEKKEGRELLQRRQQICSGNLIIH
jgi:hypothetical protein